MIFKFVFSMLSGKCNNGKLSILIYHRVLDDPDAIFTSEVHKKSFDWQMQIISLIFNVLSLNEAVNHLKNRTLPRRAMCITFDDGYLDNYQNALPVLQRYNLNATFFIATGFQDGTIMWNDRVIEAIRNTDKNSIDLTGNELGKYELVSANNKYNAITDIISKIKHISSEERMRCVQLVEDECDFSHPGGLMMSSDDVKALHSSGMQIGGHTVNHPILMSIDNKSSEMEMFEGKKYLEKLLDEKISMFAYPNGKPGHDYNNDHIAIAKKLGFEGAVSTTWGYSDKNTDIYQLKRFTPWDKKPLMFLLRLLKNLI